MSNQTHWLAAVLLTGVVAAAGCGHESVASQANQPAAVLPAKVDPAPVETLAADPARVEPIAAAPTQPKPQPKPMGQRPPADRTPARPGEAEKITFDDLNLGMQADMVYRPFLITDRVKELDGKRLSLIGYMHGGVESTKNVKEFVLLKNTECKFGPGGQADHLAQVYLEPGESTRFTKSAVKVEATLRVEPFQGTDGNTWSIFRLEGAKIVR